ncbi:MAG TPA: adenosylcobalamin-dependent ribonucleoside-diphosphate reductase [Candidatus Nanoarchaeia archaeon]|nr:adenosylcobalamin-dependent ribonucleoside-diphosphate reductase [Candidatus Nanoarchaeia archaeon]
MMAKQVMEMGQVKKRDGSLVEFNKEKIENAIFSAAKSVGGKDKKIATNLANLVIEELKKNFGNNVPTVEDVQDAVEKVLIEEGHAKTAKHYILYRQKRNEVRREKAVVLEKDGLDEVDKRFDVNALRVLKARYLRKSEDGKLIETPKQLWTRVCVHGALPELIYDTRIFDMNKKQKSHKAEDFNPKEHEDNVSIGKYKLNQHHLQALKRMYDRADQSWNAMKVSWTEFFGMLKKGELNNHEKTINNFYKIMTEKQFVPNTPAIANFGAVLGMGSACFVMDVEDSIEGIMQTLKDASIVFKSGGGIGYNFSKLRNEGDFVTTTCGVASGPIIFMTLFDKMTDVIKQGGIRRGANMGILNSNHPDIEKFITAKAGNKALKNFNISVLIMPDFWEHYEKGTPYPLRNPRTGEVVRTIDPKQLFDSIVYQAWESAEPGVIFYDKVNETNPFFESLGPIVTTNPCGEVLLYPNESCNLGSVNLWSFAKQNEDGETYFDWEGLKETVYSGCRFLDNIIDVNKFPLKAIEDMTLATRKIGFGVMGLGDVMYELKIAYNSDEGRKFMEKIMQFINYHSKLISIELAKEKGPLPYYGKSFYPKGRMPFTGFNDKKSWDFDWDEIVRQVKKHGIRNGYTTIIAPTGSISMIAGTSSGIEPVYSLIFEKNVKVGSFYYVDPVFERVMKEEGLYDEKLMNDVCENRGSIQNIPYIPDRLKKIFITAMDTIPEDHIYALATFQKWVDSSISKTNNFPANATVEYMKESYLLAYKLGCKDVTVFRDSSIQDQVLVAPKKADGSKGKEEKRLGETAQINAIKTSLVEPADLSGAISRVAGKYEGLTSCPECGTKTAVIEGCVTCKSCGWGLCK